MLTKAFAEQLKSAGVSIQAMFGIFNTNVELVNRLNSYADKGTQSKSDHQEKEAPSTGA
jgi:hypothetical protein